MHKVRLYYFFSKWVLIFVGVRPLFFEHVFFSFFLFFSFVAATGSFLDSFNVCYLRVVGLVLFGYCLNFTPSFFLLMGLNYNFSQITARNGIGSKIWKDSVIKRVSDALSLIGMIVAWMAAVVIMARMKVMLFVLTTKLNIKSLLHFFLHNDLYLLLFLLNKCQIFKFIFFGPFFVQFNKILLLKAPLKKLFLFQIVTFEIPPILLIDALH